MIKSFAVSERVSHPASSSYGLGGQTNSGLYRDPVSRAHTANDLHDSIGPVLKTMCSVFVGSEAWIMRKHEGRCEVLMSANGSSPDDWTLGQVGCCHRCSAEEGSFMISSKGERSLLCADTLPMGGQEGAMFTLVVLFNGAFQLTERGPGMLEAFRCSIQFMLGHPLAVDALEGRMPDVDVEATCACCRRLKTRQVSGWLHWDDYRLITTGKATSHSICESCAVEIYGEEITQETAGLFSLKPDGAVL